MDSGWSFGDVPRPNGEPSTGNAPEGLENQQRAQNDPSSTSTDQEMTDDPSANFDASIEATTQVPTTIPQNPDSIPVEDTLPGVAQTDQNGEDIENGENQEGQANEDGDVTEAHDDGINAPAQQPQQPVNWAPAGINNMDPSWVHSADAIDESLDCKICADAPADTERVFLDCGHVFCTECLNQNFRHALISRVNFPPKCCRNQSINFDIAQYHLEDDVMVLVLQNWEEWSDPDPTYCQTLGCAGGMIFDHFVIDQWGLCKTCNARTCTECKALESAHESPDKHPNAISDEDAELVKKEGWKQCPKCRKVIERIDGCDHMQCIACKTDFCYRCGSSLQNGMGCNCHGQNPWVQDAQADIDGAQNGGLHHDDNGNDETGDDDHENDQVDDQEDANAEPADNAHHAFDDLPPVAPSAPVPAPEPETMTVAFSQLARDPLSMNDFNRAEWVPAPNPQRNPITHALEWVSTRVEPQAGDNNQTSSEAAGL